MFKAGEATTIEQHTLLADDVRSLQKMTDAFLRERFAGVTIPLASVVYVATYTGRAIAREAASSWRRKKTYKGLRDDESFLVAGKEYTPHMLCWSRLIEN